MFVSLDPDETYAGSTFGEWLAIAEQVRNFKPLKIEDLKPQERVCEICFEPFGPSDDGSPSEEPIRLQTCGHVFGHVCLYSWLATFASNGKWWNWLDSDAFWPYDNEEAFWKNDEIEFEEAVAFSDVDNVSIAFQEDGRRRRDWRDRLNWRSDHNDDLMLAPWPQHTHELVHASCPKCRGHILIPKCGVPGWILEARLRFWDRLYEKLGVFRSVQEERHRSDFVRYLQMVQQPKIDMETQHIRLYTVQAQAAAMRFALRRGNRSLDWEQTHLRDAIFNLGCYGLPEGEYSAASYETRRVPFWCYQVDRMERGLSARVAHVADLEGHMTDAELTNYSLDFYRQLSKEVSGPWRRALFEQVGGLSSYYGFSAMLPYSALSREPS